MTDSRDGETEPEAGHLAGDDHPEGRGASKPDADGLDDDSSDMFAVDGHLIQISNSTGHKSLRIDGRNESYEITGAGYSLRSDIYAHPSSTLLEAAANFVGAANAKATLISRRFDQAVTGEIPTELELAPAIRCGRRDFMQLSPQAQADFGAALNWLYEDNIIQRFAKEHEESWHDVHFGPAFFPWHRHFLLRFETLLRRVNPSVSLPYWDWTRESDSQDIDTGPWKTVFGGAAGRGGIVSWSVDRSPGHHPGGYLPTLKDIRSSILSLDYSSFRSIEGEHHSGPHMWVGPTMAGRTSPLDPLFYLHHCNLDRLWSIWQKNHPDANQYNLVRSSWDETPQYSSDVAIDARMAGGATPRSMLDHHRLGTIYFRDQRLEAPTEVSPDVVVTGDDATVLRVVPRLITFWTEVGAVEARTLVIRNIGTRSLEVSVPEQDEGPLGWVGFEGWIRPCREVRLPVWFLPTAVGEVRALLTVTSNTGTNPQERRVTNVRVVGTGADRPLHE
ncbi:tyrosinase family protein [Mumia sp. zg.B21]|uniref:tyrosinase family protein n=1 Tax=Mumia sp. zg.B21 TaxID=2855447 RepID=UPI001C6EB99D|nr:tyrosinase family protein [Mumia sp. zg.B21]MBW9211780.1 tyrosinase family protein [Mumia sp. zg.B21]